MPISAFGRFEALKIKRSQHGDTEVHGGKAKKEKSIKKYVSIIVFSVF
jgi:hypothetical protein